MVKNLLKAYFFDAKSHQNDVFFALNDQKGYQIDNLLWSTNNYCPGVSFSMAYTQDAILLKYFVKERYATSRHTQINDLVYKDSCVEFFIAFNNNSYYYNLEFNSIGTPYMAYGSANDRATLPAEIVKQIKVVVSSHSIDKDGLTSWDISLRIPVSVFIYDEIRSLKGQECRANFYKCGDELPMPHYLSWNNILSDVPSFHVPEFFGTISFV